jgi:hypothetical protein
VKVLIRGALVVALAVFADLAWDVWTHKRLRPPAGQTFDGFVREGRKGTLLIDSAGQRLYWVAGPPGTVMPYPEPVVYEFGPSGALLNWTPGTHDFRGMMLDAPVRSKGKPATLDEARAWLRDPTGGARPSR